MNPEFCKCGHFRSDHDWYGCLMPSCVNCAGYEVMFRDQVDA